MKSSLPHWSRRFEKSYAKIWKSFQLLGEECHRWGPLDAHTRRLAKVGIAAGAGLEGALHSAVRNALAEGVSKNEIRHVILLSITTIGFPRAQAALSWAEDILTKK
jgi:alkylhydroperoxidase/carboxymuconolactone decarboxylase family protein YurZ